MNLNIINDLQNNIFSTFNNTIPTQDIIFSLITSIIIALMISFVYQKTYMGVSYTKSFSMSILLLTMVTSIVIRTITSNLALSLGMVGALSIVRFRTAVKDPVDTVFMFWAITAGIMCGVSLYVVVVLATCIIGLTYFVYYTIQTKKNQKLLLIIKTYINNAELILNTMKESKTVALKTETYKNGVAEFTNEIASRSDAEEILKFKESEVIININIIDID